MVLMMNSRSCLLSFCVCSISFTCLKAQTCPFSVLLTGGITDGVNTELIRTDTGFLLGIRVSWSWLSSVSLGCFKLPVVELLLSGGLLANSTSVTNDSRNNSVDFFNLDCNEMYTPRVKATYDNTQQLEDTGNRALFGGSERSPPPVLPKVCVGLSTALEHLGKVNISWELLPCHLQNGADISSYIILYTPLSTSETLRIPSSTSSVECSQKFGDLYSCVVTTSLIPNNQAFSIRVAAQNNNGESPFSDPVNISSPVSSTICTSPPDTVTSDAQSTASTTTSIASEGIDHSTGTDAYSQTEARLMTALIKSTMSCQEVWSLMGSLVATITIIAVIVIVVLFIINYILWKRLRSLKNDQALQKRSTLHEKIDMKECSAYGQVISPQIVTEQPHIYESTS